MSRPTQPARLSEAELAALAMRCWESKVTCSIRLADIDPFYTHCCNRFMAIAWKQNTEDLREHADQVVKYQNQQRSKEPELIDEEDVKEPGTFDVPDDADTLTRYLPSCMKVRCLKCHYQVPEKHIWILMMRHDAATQKRNDELCELIRQKNSEPNEGAKEVFAINALEHRRCPACGNDTAEMTFDPHPILEAAGLANSDG